MRVRGSVALLVGSAALIGCGSDQVVKIEIPLSEEAKSYLLFVFQEGGPEAESGPRVVALEGPNPDAQDLPALSNPSGSVRATLFSLRLDLSSLGIQNPGKIETSASSRAVPFSTLYSRSDADTALTFTGPPLVFLQPSEPMEPDEVITVGADLWGEVEFPKPGDPGLDRRIADFNLPELAACDAFEPEPAAVDTCITLAFAVLLDSPRPDRASILLGLQDQRFFRIDVTEDGRMLPAVNLGRLAPASAPLPECSAAKIDAVRPAELLPPQRPVTATVCSDLVANDAEQIQAGKRVGSWPGVHSAKLGADGRIWLGSSAGEIYTLDESLVLSSTGKEDLACSAELVMRLPSCDPIGKFAALPATRSSPLSFFASSLTGEVFEVTDGVATKFFTHSVPDSDPTSYAGGFVWVEDRKVLVSFRNDSNDLLFWSAPLQRRLSINNELAIGWSVLAEVPGRGLVSGGFEGALARWYWEDSDDTKVTFERMTVPTLTDQEMKFALRIEAVEPFESGFLFGGMNGHLGQWSPTFGFCPVSQRRTMDVIRVIHPLFGGRFLFAVGGKPASSEFALPYTLLVVQ